MLQPYSDPAARMTNRLYRMSLLVGDPTFHQFTRIEPTIADQWRAEYTSDFLGDLTWKVAANLAIDGKICRNPCFGRNEHRPLPTTTLNSLSVNWNSFLKRRQIACYDNPTIFLTKRESVQMVCTEQLHQPIRLEHNALGSKPQERVFPVPSAKTLLDGLAEMARDYPDELAICAINRTALTYATLKQHLVRMTARLSELGIGRHDRVALVLPNGPEMATAFLAVAACATAAPLNPAYRATEFDFYLSDLDAKAVIVADAGDSPVRAVAMARKIPLFELIPDVTTAGLFRLTGEAAAPSVSSGFAEAEDIALILHTSGTTARPKMVPLTHCNLLRSAYNIGATLALSPADRCLNIMPLFHIHGLMAALLASLMSGGSVVCTPGFDETRFFSWLEQSQPTWYTAVPTMHQAILMRAAIAPKQSQTGKLRFVRSSSAALSPSVMEALEQTFQAPVIEAYGMTEAAHQMTSNPLPPLRRKAGSVGLTLAHKTGPQVAIMAEETNRLLPVGFIGEVVIRGKTVTAGYVDNRGANANAFVNGWFRTGDQGYLDEEGYLFLAGRLKELINRGGEKVAPREVDEILLRHPAVAQALTFALPHPQLGETVAAAVVLHHQGAVTEGAVTEGAVTEGALREFVASHLAYFKIPTRIIFLHEIPLGSTGKLQRIGFAERINMVELTSTVSKKPYIGPRTPLEEKLADLWSAILGVRPIGIHEDFLHLGGNSLAAARIITQVSHNFQVELTMQAFFASLTIADMGLRIMQYKLEQKTSAEIDTVLSGILCDAVGEFGRQRLSLPKPEAFLSSTSSGSTQFPNSPTVSRLK